MPYVKNLIHLDSYNNRVANEYYDCKFNLDRAYNKVKGVKLLSLEMPIGFCNIHEGINEIKICIQGIFYSFYIPVRTYTTLVSIADAFTNISNQVSLHGGFTVNFLSPNTTEFQIWCTSFSGGNFGSTDWYVCDTPLTNLILGMYSTDQKSSFNVVKNRQNSQNICYNIDNYVSMHIEQVGTNSNDSRITYKIPMPLSVNNVLYLTDHIFYPQCVYCDITALQTLNIKFYDRFGNLLVSNGFTWSASLEFICEV